MSVDRNSTRLNFLESTKNNFQVGRCALTIFPIWILIQKIEFNGLFWISVWHPLNNWKTILKTRGVQPLGAAVKIWLFWKSGEKEKLKKIKNIYYVNLNFEMYISSLVSIIWKKNETLFEVSKFEFHNQNNWKIQHFNHTINWNYGIKSFLNRNKLFM